MEIRAVAAIVTPHSTAFRSGDDQPDHHPAALITQAECPSCPARIVPHLAQTLLPRRKGLVEIGEVVEVLLERSLSQDRDRCRRIRPSRKQLGEYARFDFLKELSDPVPACRTLLPHRENAVRRTGPASSDMQ
ncbi:hypothetical protein ADK93_10290 [Streptomyces sp. XY58]|nr:hypothetical protein ADK93_10290 [Streptomyces sp. XY58]KOV12698.1 hypothetical protein ADK89_00005 [Streptomyces sp. XY37]KOV56748.1 hypothetical protein ADK99_02065 [Streptomyces sp. MMG1064]